VKPSVLQSLLKKLVVAAAAAVYDAKKTFLTTVNIDDILLLHLWDQGDN